MTAPQLHGTDRPSTTAQWTALGRALELHRPDPIVRDPYAPAFLDRANRRLLRALLAAGPAVRRAEQLALAGLAASSLCRHRFVDEQLMSALGDVEQVLLLGAGYDARAWRFTDAIGERPVYEVDLPPLSRRKAKIVAAQPELFGHASVHRVELNFQRDSLAHRLDLAGFTAGAPTFVAWEGVSMYLTRAAVDATLSALATVCGTGSVLAMDFWQQVRGPGGYQLRLAVQRGMRLVGEPITFVAPAEAADDVLTAHGFAPFDLADAAELTLRYATGGRRCDPGTYLTAARL